MHAGVSMYICGRVYVYMWVCVCMWGVYACIGREYVYIYGRVYVCGVCMHACGCEHVYMWACVCLYVGVCMYVECVCMHWA